MAKAGFSDDVMAVIKAAAPTVGGILGSAIPIPGVGTALGAAAANLAVDALGRALGVEPKPEAINARIEKDLAVINANGSGALVKHADLNLALHRADDIAIAKINADLEVASHGLNNADTANARSTFTAAKDYTQKGIGLLIVLGFFAVLGVMMYRVVPPENREFFLVIVGQLAGAFIVVVGFYFGSSQGSKRNADSIRSELAKR